MLDQVSAIAFEMQSSKGVFALLLGSGVSYTSKIPTGWAITLDLVRRIAAVRGEQCGEKPDLWYREKFNKEPDYSDLLDMLGSTPSLRQDIIRKYIEPSDAERALGEKQPTSSHRAIAGLMAKGYIRVVLTTNFDRLLEQALAEVGAQATVISASEHVAGAKPLVHAGPTIVKLHGDYLDVRIRNTSGELATYEPEMDELLDRVLDEFGLIVCGWSADWDAALKAAIERARSRRYPLYWASYGSPTLSAKRLIDRRAGRFVNIAGADSFFDNLAEKVHAIEAMQIPHPKSAALAVAMLKEYMAEPRHEIRLHDLVMGEVNQVLAKVRSFKNPSEATFDTALDFANRCKVVSSVLVQMAYTAGRWSRAEHVALWTDVVGILSAYTTQREGDLVFTSLRALPATLIMYAFALGATVGKRPESAGKMFTTRVEARPADADDELTFGLRLNIDALIQFKGQEWFCRYEDHQVAGSIFVRDALREMIKDELDDRHDLDAAYLKVEIALAFHCAEWLNVQTHYIPNGLYVWGRRSTENLISRYRSSEGEELQQLAGLQALPAFSEVENSIAEYKRRRR
jgi:hypothetical protein